MLFSPLLSEISLPLSLLSSSRSILMLLSKVSTQGGWPCLGKMPWLVSLKSSQGLHSFKPFHFSYCELHALTHYGGQNSSRFSYCHHNGPPYFPLNTHWLHLSFSVLKSFGYPLLLCACVLITSSSVSTPFCLFFEVHGDSLSSSFSCKYSKSFLVLLSSYSCFHGGIWGKSKLCFHPFHLPRIAS